MSKAFTREDDSADQDLPARRLPAPLPGGVKNYITPDGLARLQKDLADCLASRKSEVPDRNLDQRIAALSARLNAVEVLGPPSPATDQVRFGAFVKVRDQEGTVSTYRLVGVDEADLEPDWISWRSPLARALLNASKGSRIKFVSPAGVQDLEILDVSYS